MFSGQKFFDDKHFPKGFKRAGCFTIKEARILEESGRAMKALFDGSQEPVKPEEQVFIDEVNGVRTAQSEYARCWLKYLAEINHRHVNYSLCSTTRKSYEERVDSEPLPAEE
ncbi:DUF413 domain-containing protein [Veronia pacifica]|uniref:Macrodomain Ori protein n=1 Tax=Veronia pacifica TaxID=1080227 RepID=A0A1C3EPG4_9GAMM|nr:DUF413 domain-containing protein [Veronia pacifica]ODA35082.1 hypothetical protein A8L45_05230 [Veronia pacifica]